MPDPTPTPKPPAGDPPAPPTPAPPAPGATPPAKDPAIEALEKQVEALKQEVIEKRLESKPFKALETAMRQAFGIPDDKTPVADQLAAAKRAAELEERETRLSVRERALAAGALDSDDVAKVIDLNDVEPAKRRDAKLLDERLAALKARKPYLFTQPASPTPPAPGAPAPAPSPSPAPPRPPAGGNGGGTPGEEYMRLLKDGKKEEAQKLYLANRKAVGDYVRQHGGAS